MKFPFSCLILFTSFFLQSNTAWAVAVGFEYACLGIDGFPISNGTAQATQCCRNGELVSNPPALCKAGFNSIASGAVAGATLSANLAQRTLDTARDLNGATLTYTSPTPSSHGSGGLSSSSGSALTSAGSGSAGDGTGSGNANGSGSDDGATSAGGSGAGGAGAGGAGSVALGNAGSTGSTNGKNAATGAGGGSSDSAGGYAKVGGAGGDSDKNGLGGINFANIFGKDGAGAKGAGDAALGEIKFDGDESDSAKNAANELSGSSSDPSDYFNRIDKTASLFKIVSNRYTKETIKKHVGHFENKVEK